jgi:hypothetical protein
MEPDYFNFKDRIKEIETSFVKDGWVTVYENSESSNQNQYMIFCCLVTEQRIKSYKESTDWIIDPGSEGKPSIIGSFKNGKMVDAYHQFADEGIEPFIFLRRFHLQHATYVDISEDFVSYFKLYEQLTDKLNRNYSFINDLGELIEVISVEPRVVKVKLKFLMEFISIRRMYLSICFDFMRLADLSKTTFEINFHDTIHKHGNAIYSRLVRHMGFSLEGCDLQSWIHGKTIIGYDESKSQTYHFEGDGMYEEFITGYNTKGDFVFSSCRRDDSKFFVLTYFNKEVLNKYYNDPERYEVTGWHVMCPFFTLKIDNNVADYVPVLLKELATLPHKEQLHWKQFNIAPQKGISQSYCKTMIEGNWVSHPESADLFFKQRYSEFNEKWESQFGWKFFKPLSKEDSHNFKGLHIPTTNSIKAFCEQVLALVKLIIDSVNERELAKGITLEPNEKTITKLEKFLEMRRVSIPELIEFLRNLQSLRSGLIAHRFSNSNSDLQKALRYFNLDENNRVEVARKIFFNAIWMVNSLEMYLVNQVEIRKPSEFTQEETETILRLIAAGDQIPDIELVRSGLERAEYIGIVRCDGGTIASTATIKNPLDSYRTRVFKSAGVPQLSDLFEKELGYICTDSKYEGRKLCQLLLSKLLEDYDQALFATTRKPSMIHVLKKFGFEKSGVTYSGDLELYTRKSQ